MPTNIPAFLHGKSLPDPRIIGHADAPLLIQTLFEDTKRIPDTAECVGISSKYYPADLDRRQVLNSRKTCDVCSEPGNPYSVKAAEWQEHLKSRIHRR